MILEILTPDEKVFSGEVYSVNLPGVNGLFEVLGGHAALVSNLQRGLVTVRKSAKEEQKFMIDGGLVEVSNNKVSVLAEAILK
ncbi:MAG: ATP synthase F1 subunit epsilon [Cytophagaceae bacterium]|jgi:F-type H+-transporting ATPase subunit epsilon|nr:ATP synthase F1 subunit epsilon [Cytophagaceae bacterium]